MGFAPSGTFSCSSLYISARLQRAVARILAGAQLLDDALALKLHQGVGHPLLAAENVGKALGARLLKFAAGPYPQGKVSKIRSRR